MSSLYYLSSQGGGEHLGDGGGVGGEAQSDLVPHPAQRVPRRGEGDTEENCKTEAPAHLAGEPAEECPTGNPSGGKIF